MAWNWTKTCVSREEDWKYCYADDGPQTTEEVEEAIKKGLPAERPVSVAVASDGIEVLKCPA
jgi:hypothetical protein